MEPLEMDIVPGFIPEASNPCIFQLGYSFYDFTPFKVHVPSLTAQWKNGRKDVRTIVFSWCQALDKLETGNAYSPAACDQQDIFAGIISGKTSEISPDDTCFGLSDGKLSSINAVNIIQGVPNISTLRPSYFSDPVPPSPEPEPEPTPDTLELLELIGGIGPDIDKRPRDGI